MFVRDDLQNFKTDSDLKFPSPNLLMALIGAVMSLFVTFVILILAK